MSFRLSAFSCGVVLAVLGWSSVPLGTAQAEDKRLPVRELELAETNHSEVLNQLKQFNANKNGLKQLEKELSKSFQSFSPKSSLEGVVAPQYRVPVAPFVPNRRLKEELDHRNDWMLMDPKDAQSTKPGEELLNLPGFSRGERDKKKGSLEEFYESLSRQRVGGGSVPGFGQRDDPLATRQRSGGREEGSDEADLPSGVKETAHALKHLLGGDTKGTSSLLGSAPARNSFSDIFGLGDNTLSSDQVLSHKAYIDQFKQAIQGMPSAGTPSAFGALGAPEPSRAPVNSQGLDAYSNPARPRGPAFSPSGPDLVLKPVGLVDPNATVLNQWNPMYTPPKLESARPAPFNVPLMEVPKRRF